MQYLVWKHDPEGLKKRLERFLAIADKHGITTTLVLFDDCAFGDPPQTEPYLGKQRDPIPGMIAPSWTPSPGLKAVTDRTAWPDLEKYVKDVVGAFGRDKRVLMWDLYNEPGNSGMGNKSLPLVEATFAWARAGDPVAAADDEPVGRARRDQPTGKLELSDVVSFHFYGNYDGLRRQIAALQAARAAGHQHGMDGAAPGQPVGDGPAAVQAGSGRLLQLGPGERPHAMPVRLVPQAGHARAEGLVPRPVPRRTAALTTRRNTRPSAEAPRQFNSHRARPK